MIWALIIISEVAYISFIWAMDTRYCPDYYKYCDPPWLNFKAYLLGVVLGIPVILLTAYHYSYFAFKGQKATNVFDNAVEVFRAYCGIDIPELINERFELVKANHSLKKEIEELKANTQELIELRDSLRKQDEARRRKNKELIAQLIERFK